MVLSAYALKYLLKVVGDLVERMWGGAGESLLVCMRGAVFRWYLVVLVTFEVFF